MKFSRPIVFFDLESTGLDITNDRIIEYAAIKYESGIPPTNWHSLFYPGFPIPAESTEIHGITNEAVRNQPKFGQLAPDIRDFMDGCIIAGFNCRNFDIPLLWEEFFRAGIEWNIQPKDIIDAGNIFKLKHPRNLEAAVEKYCNRKHEDAHSALADAEATADVFRSQLDQHDDLFDMDSDQLAEYCMMEERRADLCGTIVYNTAGLAVFNTKRNKGVPVLDDIGYARWMLKSDFPQSIKRAIEKILDPP